jgi:hypothetical protein
MLQSPETLRRWMFCGRSHYKDGRVAALPSTVKGEFPTFPQGYEIVPRKLDPGLRHRRHGGTTPDPF